MKTLLLLTACILLSSRTAAQQPALLASAAATTATADPASTVTTPPHESAAYSAIRGQELMLNGFRAPSIGLEYRLGMLSIHAGAYPTIINENETAADGTTWFAKLGMSAWFLPIHMLGNERSSFYAGASYLKQLDSDNWGHSVQVEAGFRLVAYAGLFVRLGASALYAPGRSCAVDGCEVLKVRPNPSIGWAFAID
jgi:hypothetical protein